MTRFSVVATVKTTPDMAAWFASHHLGAGATRVHLFLDDPEADDIVERLSGDNRISLTRCTDAHWSALGGRPKRVEGRQKKNADVAMQQAVDEGVDWLFHLDVDELLDRRTDTAAVLAALPPDVLVARIGVLEAVPSGRTGMDAFAAVTEFKVGPPLWTLAFRPRLVLDVLRMVLYTVRVGIARAVCPSLRHGLIKGHAAGKVAARVRPDRLRWGIHNVKDARGGPAPSRPVGAPRLLHYYACDAEEWREKWLARPQYHDSAHQPNMRGIRRRQFLRFMAAREEGAVAVQALYVQEYVVPARERRVLRALGLLVRVDGST